MGQLHPGRRHVVHGSRGRAPSSGRRQASLNPAPRSRCPLGVRRGAWHTPRPMSSLAGRSIATVGSGVMAEAIIAGLLRGNLVAPDRVVASHPRADRREALERLHGIRTVESNADAVEGADIVLLGIKPQMLARVGRELRGRLRPGQLVISILAGATTRALAG